MEEGASSVYDDDNTAQRQKLLCGNTSTMSGMPNYQSLVDEQPTGAMPALVEGESLPRQPDKSCTDSCQICCLKFTDSCFPWYK